MRSFIHGTTYYHFANPTDEFEENFRRMKDMGINTVRVAEIWPGWEVLEPEPERFDFSGLDTYVQAAARAGLSMVMGIGINNPPFWVFTDLPDVRCVDVSGRVAVRRVQSANHDHPEYRRLMQRFVDTLVARYVQVPEVIAWQFGNEARYGVDIADNECTRVRFRDWLRKEYDGDLSRLNEQWGVVYRSWEEVFPYQSSAGAPTQGLSPLAIASRRYQAWSLEELIAWGTGLVRKHSSLPVFHNNNGVSGPSGSHWRICRACDLVVHDIYPSNTSSPQTHNRFLLDCAASIARSQKKDLWIGETSVGQYGTFHRDKPSPALIETLVVEMIGAGAKGLLYFRHKAPRFEQPHKYTGSQPAFRRDGSELPYAQTIRTISGLMDTWGARILQAEPVKPKIGLYYPEESYLFSGAAGYEALQKDASFGASALWGRIGHPVHMLPTEQLLTEDLSSFPLVYLPLSYLLPAEVGAALRRYVQGGGILVSEARPGYVDGNGWLYEKQPGAGLDEVFGAREDLFWNRPSSQHIQTPFGDGVFRDAFQSFRLEGGTPAGLFSSGEIAAVRHAFGKGCALLLGFAPSLAFSASDRKYDVRAERNTSEEEQIGALHLVKSIASEFRVQPPVPLEFPHHEFSTRTLESEGERLVFLMNYGRPAGVVVPAGMDVLAFGGEMSGASRNGRLRFGNYAWAMLSCR